MGSYMCDKITFKKLQRVGVDFIVTERNGASQTCT